MVIRFCVCELLIEKDDLAYILLREDSTQTLLFDFFAKLKNAKSIWYDTLLAFGIF